NVELQLRRSGECVAATLHRRRAGMRRLALEGDEMALDAEGAEDNPQRKAEALEHRALLDVQLEVGGGVLELAPRLDRPVELDAALREDLGQRAAVRVVPLTQLVLVGHRARGGDRPEQAAREVRDLHVRTAEWAHRAGR